MRRKSSSGRRARHSLKAKGPSDPSNTYNRTLPSLPSQCIDDASERCSSEDELQGDISTYSVDKIISDTKNCGKTCPENIFSQEDICIDVLGKEFCIECNEGGQVLVCCEKSCPVVLHEKCIPCRPKFDDIGNFYCPYCWYKRAVEEARELKKKALLAKKGLSEFLNHQIISGDKDGNYEREGPNVSPLIEDGRVFDHDSNQQGITGVGDIFVQIVEDQQKEIDRAELPSDDQHEVVIEGEAHARTSPTNASDTGLCREEDTMVLNKLVECSMTRRKPEESSVSKAHQLEQVEVESPGLNVGNIPESFGKDSEEPLHESDIESDSREKIGRILRRKKVSRKLKNICTRETGNISEENEGSRDGKHEHKEFLQVPANASFGNENINKGVKRKDQKGIHQNDGLSMKSPLCKQNTAEENVQNQNGNASSSKKSREPQNLSRRVKKLNLLNERRKRLFWTGEEEDMLKEGVIKFTEENQKIPWRKILEFGRHVFDSTRTPMDLKCKWRNIVSKERGN